MTLSLNDPTVQKLGAGAALYWIGGSRLVRLAGLALAGWGVWEYLQDRPKLIYQAPADPGAVQVTPWAYPAHVNLGGLR